MFKEIIDPEMDMALREGLRSVITPVAGPDFDARVLGAIEKPVPWWQTLRLILKPAFGGAAFSLIATLFIVNWAMKEPDKAAPGGYSGITTASIEKALDSPNLTSASLTRLRPIRSAAKDSVAIPQSAIRSQQSEVNNPQSAITTSRSVTGPVMPHHFAGLRRTVMNGSKKLPRVSLLAGLAIGVLGALLIIPATRWIVRSDIGLALPFGDNRASLAYLGVRDSFGQPDLNRAAEMVEKYAADRPNDYQAQLGAAMTFLRPLPAGKHLDYAEAVKPLMSRFPDNPSAFANYLRLMCMGRIRLHRDEEEFPEFNQSRTDTKSKNKPIAQEDRDRFAEAAAAGERLDPGNAYFPMMAALGMFSGHRDSDAYAAMERASNCTAWREYYDDQVYAQWRLADEALGDPSSITRTAIAAAVLFPHLSNFRSVARLVLYQAITLEKEGHFEEALRMRHCLMRCGAIMRAKGQTLICNLVGNAIASIAASRPEGAAPIITDSKMPNEKRKELALQPYVNYLHKISHDDEAEWVKTEFASQVRFRDITSHGLQTWDVIHELLTVLAWRIGGILLLCSALLTLILGAASAMLGRSRWFKAGKALPAGAVLGVWLAISFTVFGIGVALGNKSEFMWPLIGTGFAASLVSFLCCGRRIGRPAALTFLASLGFIVLLVLGAVWQIGGIAGLFKVVQGLTAGECGGSAGNDLVPMIAMTYGVTVGVPLITIIGLAIFSKVCKVPVAIGIVRGMRGLALPIASAMILIYGATTVQTARKDAKLSYNNARWVQHEGKWYAERGGKEWPGLSW